MASAVGPLELVAQLALVEQAGERVDPPLGGDSLAVYQPPAAGHQEGRHRGDGGKGHGQQRAGANGEPGLGGSAGEQVLGEQGKTAPAPARERERERAGPPGR